MHAVRNAAVVLLVLLAGGCSSGDAFVDRNYMLRSVKKQKLPGHDGQVIVCHGSDTPRAERDRLAAEACEVYGLSAALISETRWQCRLTVPHRAEYICFDPDMRTAEGRLVNPYSPSQVEDWRREQARAKEAAPPSQSQPQSQPTAR